MSEYSSYRYCFTKSVNNIAEINRALLILKNAREKRKEPVPKHVTNLFYNIKLASEMEQIAHNQYNVALQELNVANIIPVDWIPTFEELKRIAETADSND